MATKIKRNSKGTAKGLAISAGAGVAGGATTGFVAKTLFGKHTQTQEVPITWDNLNDDLMFKAIQNKWSSSANGADLSTREGWLQMITNFKDMGQPGLAQNATNDLYDVTAMSQDGISFSGLTTKEQLAEYISGQDVSDSVRDSVSEYVKTAFSLKWNMPYDASDADYARLIYQKNNPQITQQLMDDRLMIKNWSGEGLTEADLDAKLAGDYDVSNMTLEEKCNTLIDWADNHYESVFKNGYSSDNLTSAIYQKGYSSADHVLNDAQAATAGRWVNTYDYYTNLHTLRDGTEVDVSDFIESMGSSAYLTDAQTTVTNNRQELLQNGIEDKFNLSDGSVDITSPDTSVLSQVPADSKESLINNIVDAGAYIRDQNAPIPDDVKDIAARTGVREIVEGWISNGDTTTVEQTVGSLGLPEISGISGIGALVTFGVTYMCFRHKMNKMQKMFDDAKAQIAELEGKMDNAEQNEHAPELVQKKGLFGRRK